MQYSTVYILIYEIPAQPRVVKFCRKKLYRVVQHNHYELFTLLCITSVSEFWEVGRLSPGHSVQLLSLDIMLVPLSLIMLINIFLIPS